MHVPLLWGSVLSAVILVFVDVLKELPATLILRPFNFETLAVRVYRFASDERLAEASTAALAIVLVGLRAGHPAQPGDRTYAPGSRGRGVSAAIGRTCAAFLHPHPRGLVRLGACQFPRRHLT